MFLGCVVQEAISPKSPFKIKAFDSKHKIKGKRLKAGKFHNKATITMSVHPGYIIF